MTKAAALQSWISAMNALPYSAEAERVALGEVLKAEELESRQLVNA